MTSPTRHTPDLASRAGTIPTVKRPGRSRPPEPGPAAPAPAGAPPSVLGPLGLLTLLLGAALPMIDFFIVNVALPTIDRDLHAGPALLELVVAGYGVAYAIVLVLGGRLGDTLGRRRLFLTGTALFALASLACGLAPDAWTLVAARVVQGGSAALMVPQVLATIQSATTGEHRGRALGLFGATAGIASIIGQVAGGWLVTANLAGSGWRSIFLVNVPLAVAAILLCLRTVPETRSPRPSRVDVRGTLLLAATLLTLLAPLVEGHSVGRPWWTWVLLAASPVLGTAFWRVERRTEEAGGDPLLPPSLLANPGMRGGLWVALPFFAGLSGFMFVMAVSLQQGLGLDPVTAGLALAPMAVTYFAASLLAPRLVRRFGRYAVTSGLVIQGAGLLGLVATAFARWPHLSVPDLVPAVSVLGFGQGLVLGPLFRVVLAEVPPERAGVGGGVLSTTQQTALALGVATLGTLYLSLSSRLGTAHAMEIVLLVQLATTVAAVALSTRLPRAVA